MQYVGVGPWRAVVGDGGRRVRHFAMGREVSRGGECDVCVF